MIKTNTKLFQSFLNYVFSVWNLESEPQCHYTGTENITLQCDAFYKKIAIHKKPILSHDLKL